MNSEDLRKSWISFSFDSFNRAILEGRYAPSSDTKNNLIVFLWEEAWEFEESENIESVKPAILTCLKDIHGKDFSKCIFEDIGIGPYDPKYFIPNKRLYRISDLAEPISD